MPAANSRSWSLDGRGTSRDFSFVGGAFSLLRVLCGLTVKNIKKIRKFSNYWSIWAAGGRIISRSGRLRSKLLIDLKLFVDLGRGGANYWSIWLSGERITIDFGHLRANYWSIWPSGELPGQEWNRREARWSPMEPRAQMEPNYSQNKTQNAVLSLELSGVILR